MTEHSQPTPGDTAYLEDGTMVEVVANLHGDGWAVRSLYHEDDWGEPNGETFTTRGPLWKEPPRARYEERITELRAEIDGLVEVAKANREGRAAFERDEREMRERVRRHGLLEQIDAALDNRLTHIVRHSSWDNRVKVQSLAEALKDNDSRYRLYPLKLEAKHDGEAVRLTWTSEGHSADGRVFTSEEEAKAFAKAALEDLFRSFQRDPAAEGYRLIGVIESARALGVEVPADLAERHRAHMEGVYRKNLEQAERGVSTAQAQLAAYLKPELEQA